VNHLAGLASFAAHDLGCLCCFGFSCHLGVPCEVLFV
jgi:hypothetical protein